MSPPQVQPARPAKPARPGSPTGPASATRPAIRSNAPRLALDVLGWAAVTGGLWLSVPAPTGLHAWQWALATATLPGLLVRGRWPLAAFAITAAATATGWSLNVTADPFLLAAACLLAVAERTPSRYPPAMLWVPFAVVLAGGLVVGGPDSFWRARLLLVGLVILALAWLLGARTRTLLAEHTARVAAQERLAMSRDVHDTLSHALGTIGVQAGVAAHLRSADADRLRATLRQIETQARAATTDLRALLHAGPDQPPGSAPLADLLADLAASAHASGLSVTLDSTPDLEAAPAPVRTTIYRIVQEALTNAVRHSGAHTCHIGLTTEHGGVRLTVTDDGAGAVSWESAGRGLVGMRERVALLGGKLAVDPGPPGFSVRAWLPLAGEGA